MLLPLAFALAASNLLIRGMETGRDMRKQPQVAPGEV